MKKYLQNQLLPLNREALWSKEIFWSGASLVCWWAVPAFLIVLIVDYFHDYLPSVYLTKAIGEGIGPHLWNVIGTLGLAFVGIAILFPKSKFIAKSAYHLLTNTYTIGGLSFGLLFGQFFTSLASAQSNIEAWKAWLIGAGSIFVIIQVLLLNFSLWYLGHLMGSREREDGFLHRVEQISLPIRIVAFVFFTLLPLSLLLMET